MQGKRNRSRKRKPRARRLQNAPSLTAAAVGPEHPQPNQQPPSSGSGEIDSGPARTDVEHDQIELSDNDRGQSAARAHDPIVGRSPEADQTTSSSPPRDPPMERGEPELYAAAREAAESGHLQKAVTLYREVLHGNPGHVRARNNLALVLDQLGSGESALEELNRCLELEPENTQVRVNRGSLLGSLGHYQEAERDLERVLELDSANPEAHYNLGIVLSRKGLWAKSIQHLRRAIELDSTQQAAAYYYLGEGLNQVDDLEGALNAYMRSDELRPTNSNTLYGIGVILDRLNRPEEAAQMYRRSRDARR